MDLSVILPTLNEAEALPGCLAALRTNRTAQRFTLQLVVSDAGSTDGTRELARRLGCTVVPSDPGRGRQLNRGVLASRGAALLFLHADTLLPPGWDSALMETLERPGVVGGAFRFELDPVSGLLRLVEWGVRIRGKLMKDPYGDQALFCRREVFETVKGFPDQALMEDVAFVKALKAKGKLVILDLPVTTSARRWVKNGILSTTMDHMILRWGYRLGRDPQRLAAWRYRRTAGNQRPERQGPPAPASAGSPELSHTRYHGLPNERQTKAKEPSREPG